MAYSVIKETACPVVRLEHTPVPVSYALPVSQTVDNAQMAPVASSAIAEHTWTVLASATSIAHQINTEIIPPCCVSAAIPVVEAPVLAHLVTIVFLVQQESY